MATSLDVDDICTEAVLIAELGGDTGRLTRAMRDSAARDAMRAAALQDVVDSLATRSPPVRDTDLLDPTELRRAVCYRALSKIFMAGITQRDDVHDVLSVRYEKEYQAAVRTRFTLSPGVSAPSGHGFQWDRR
jgi:hypothetical protein